MKLERSKNAVRNVTAGLLNRIVGIVFPFIIRTIFIKFLSAEYLGLNSLFSSILTVLNLTELGFSSAIVFCMYKPIAEDDIETINALLYFYKSVYRVIGLIILIAGLVVVPFLPYLIKGPYPAEINIRIVYIVYLLNTVLSYFMFSYLGSLISAYQREDIISKINVTITIGMYLVQILVICLFRDYYLYLVVMPVFTILNNVKTAIVAKKMFPDLRPVGRLSIEYKQQIKEKVSGLVISKVCQVSRNAFDSIFISMFLGLIDTAIYNNYYYIMNSIIAITNVVTSSITSGVGNSVAMESEKKNYADMDRFNFLYMWLSGWCTVCLMCLYQPFMQLWVGDIYILKNVNVLLLCMYFYVLKMGDIRYVYDQAKGLWWQNRFRSLAEAMSNIILNYYLGKHFGITGIICATLISLFIFNFCLGSRIIFKYYFVNENPMMYFLKHARYAAVTVMVGCITYICCSALYDGVVGLIIKGVICLILPNVLYLFVYHKQRAFEDALSWLGDRFIFMHKIANRRKEIK